MPKKFYKRIDKRNRKEMMETDEFYDSINMLLDEFGQQHNYTWQAGFNGRSSGYLVLYKGSRRQSGYKSYCRLCGQKNYQLVEGETGKCGRCGEMSRVNYMDMPDEIFKYPGQSVDMHEDFSDWGIEEIKERVKLIQEFDMLSDSVVEEAVYIAQNYRVEDDEYLERKSRKILVET